MISTYTLRAEATYTLRSKCVLCWKWCFIDWKVAYTAFDTTDFNPGDDFGIEIGGVEYKIDDQLILDCNIGAPFDISASSSESGTWLENCERDFGASTEVATKGQTAKLGDNAQKEI